MTVTVETVRSVIYVTDRGGKNEKEAGVFALQ